MFQTKKLLGGFIELHRLVEGTIRIETDECTDYKYGVNSMMGEEFKYHIKQVYLWFPSQYGGRKVKELIFYKSDHPTDRYQRNVYFHPKLFKPNLIKENQTMANKLMALVRLNKNQRKLAKAGVYDENGNLTPDGQEVLLNLLAKDKEAELVELVKDWKTDKKDKSDDE